MTGKARSEQDKFVAMVTAKAEISLPSASFSRLVFGADLLPEESMYRLYFRFLETADEYFDYPSHASRQGRWNIYGLFLPDDDLRKVYRENALRLLSIEL